MIKKKKKKKTEIPFTEINAYLVIHIIKIPGINAVFPIIFFYTHSDL